MHKIGIFGGSFNPPHEMHKNIALSLINDKVVDEIIFVPTGNKYKKNELIDSKYRLDMLNIMTKNYSDLNVSDFELKNTQIYTYQTLDYFNKDDNSIYLIIGSDNYKDIKNWKNKDYILKNYNFIVINRGTDNIKSHDNIIVYNIEKNNISSTKIRNNILDYKDKIDYEILEYINNYNLYKV